MCVCVILVIVALFSYLFAVCARFTFNIPAEDHGGAPSDLLNQILSGTGSLLDIFYVSGVFVS